MENKNRFLTPDAVEKLRQVRAHILREPNRLIMGAWIRLGSCVYDPLDGFDSRRGITIPVKPPCGTAACIAGWICILNDKEHLAGPQAAAEVLGVEKFTYSYSMLGQLFYTTEWDDDLYNRFQTYDLQQRAEVAAEAINRFIERHALVA